MNRILDDFQKNKTWLYFALIATFLWGMAAHGYMFFNNAFSHDSLHELHGAIVGNDIRLFSGRVFVPLYRDLLRSDVTLPWLIGLLSLLWAGLAVFLVLRMFRIESKLLAFLTAGIFVTNTTFSGGAATYLHDLDCFMFSLLFAVAAVYLWRECRWGWLLGAPLITVSLGMYQSFLFTAATLVIFLCVLDLMEGKSAGEVFGRGLKSLGMFAVGGGLYWIATKVLSGDRLSSGFYNSMDLALQLDIRTLPGLIVQAYADWWERLWNLNTVYPAILVRAATLGLLALMLAAVGLWLLDRRVGIWEKVLALVLLALLPLAMNLLYVLTGGMNHDLMVFAIWLVYLLALLLGRWLAKRWKPQQWLCMALVALILYGNVQFANGLYLKKDLEYDAYLSLMTRVADRMEQTEGYVPGQTPVIFVGLPGQSLNQVMPGFKDYWNVVGMLSSDVIYMPEPSRYQAYFDYVLGVPLRLVEGEAWTAGVHGEFAASLPIFPSQGCVAMHEGVLYVKLSSAPAL